MVGTYFETDELKKLSDIDLVWKQLLLEEKLSKSQQYPDIYEQLNIFNEAYLEEIERRESLGLFDYDEIEDEIEFRYKNWEKYKLWQILSI